MDGTVLFSAFYDICLAKNVPDLSNLQNHHFDHALLTQGEHFISMILAN